MINSRSQLEKVCEQAIEICKMSLQSSEDFLSKSISKDTEEYLDRLAPAARIKSRLLRLLVFLEKWDEAAALFYLIFQMHPGCASGFNSVGFPVGRTQKHDPQQEELELKIQAFLCCQDNTRELKQPRWEETDESSFMIVSSKTLPGSLNAYRDYLAENGNTVFGEILASYVALPGINPVGTRTQESQLDPYVYPIA
jgi:hypothetical protein